MGIVQDAYDIPNDISTGLATGLYRRIGSVVRYATGEKKGQIIKHLKPVDIKDVEQAKGIGSNVLQFVKQHKKGTVIAVVGVALVGGVTWGYKKMKNKEPQVVTDFKNALKVYIDAIRKGSMDINKINSVIECLEKIKSHKNYKKIQIQLTTEELGILVGRIYDYTIKLANDNDVILAEDELDVDSKKDSNVIIDLQKYLMAQKRIFEEAS